ncbi:hypothetical protein [Bacilliculturomica massiliensis]|uniref:hypothetical protein n=1 Tax=Bacilliculturomica massiliensis TaxID=1917867 RepID=UPI001030487C|nr:hypothetical protein [Bacilliculturomica massiliensis]
MVEQKEKEEQGQTGRNIKEEGSSAPLGGAGILDELYGRLADLIPEALAEDFVGRGFAKGRYYDGAEKRILVVEKIPRPERVSGAACAHAGGHVGGHGEDDKDFTPVIARVAANLLGIKSTEWTDYVAWTYLYKLAPRIGKPDSTVYSKQKALCQEIIREEIRTLSPTLVLFLTGWGGVWDFDLPLSSLLKGEAVEGWGRMENGTDLIVTRYAVRRPEEKFASDILEKIQQLEELEMGETGI